jgi:hypothetical protein
MKKIYVLLAVLLNFISPIKSQLDSLITILNDYNKHVLNEQVYIQTDREVYSPGDTIYFKAYIREQKTLNEIKLSQELNIILLDDEGNQKMKIRFLIFDSKSNGQIFIGSNFKEGLYHIVTYTSWMKNFDPTKVYNKKILVTSFTKYEMVPEFNKGFYFPGDTVRLKMKCLNNLFQEVKSVNFSYLVNSKKSGRVKSSTDGDVVFVLDSTIKAVPKITFSGKYKEHLLDTIIEIPSVTGMNVAFFPEGGHCINGYLSKVAFKATLSNGEPANIKGAVFNDEGEKLFNVATEHAGMGLFLFMAQKDKKFYFRTEGCFSKCSYELPHGVDNGWILSVTGQKADSLTLYVAKTSQIQEMALMTLRIRNSIVYYNAFPISLYRALVIKTDSLPSGIAVVTVFDKNMRPQAERLVFINFPKLNTTELTTNSLFYQPRDSVSLCLKIKDKSQFPNSDFSLSVFDDKLGSTNTIDEPGIIASSYLSPEIKGNIYNPDYYFSSDSAIIREHLDLLLLIQGWRNYNYLSGVNSMKKPVNRETIKGQLKRFKFGVGLTPTKGKVNLFYNLNGTQIETDEKGNFSFTPIYEKGYNPNMFLSASNANGKIDVSLVIDSDYFDNNLTAFLENKIDSLNKAIITTNVFQQNKGNLIPNNEKQLNKEDQYWFEEIVVTAKKPEYRDPILGFVEVDISRKLNKNLYKTVPDINYLINVVCPTAYYDSEKDCYSAYYHGDYAPIFFYVDEINYYEDYRTALTTHVENIKEFYLLKGTTTQLLFGSPLVIAIVINTDKEDFSRKPIFPRNTIYFKDFPFTKEFYSPTYDTEKKCKSEIPDVRRTIFWEPNVKFNENGEAHIKFYNADRHTKIKCIAEGFAGNNTPVSVGISYSIISK